MTLFPLYGVNWKEMRNYFAKKEPVNIYSLRTIRAWKTRKMKQLNKK